MPDPLGRRLLKSLVNSRDFSFVQKIGITKDDLFDEARDAYQWVIDYHLKHKDYPTLRSVEEQFSFTFESDTDKPEYICEVIRKRSLSKKLESGLRQAIKSLENKDPDEALKTIVNSTLNLKSTSAAKQGPIVYSQTGKDRLQAYKDAKSGAVVEGIPTPWPALTKLIQGWVDGQLYAVVARQNVGKSWVSCIIAEHCERLEKKVLLVTEEMSASRIARRIDAIKYKLPFTKLRDSELDKDVEEKWEKAIVDKATSGGAGEIVIVDKSYAKTTKDVLLLVQQQSPDVVVIDGAYRFSSDGKAEGWEKSAKIVEDLQTFAESTNIPWIATTQLKDGLDANAGKKQKGPDDWRVRYAQEWLINPDVVLGLKQDEDMRLVNTMEINPLKIRDGGDDRFPVSINWNMQEMDFSELTFPMGREVTESEVQKIEF